MRTAAELESIIVNAEMSAVAAFGFRHSPMTQMQTIVIACTTVWDEAQRLAESEMSNSELQRHLTSHALRVLNETRAGMVSRVTLIDRIGVLPEDQRIAIALRSEQRMSDAEIAAVMGRTEDEVAALILQALQAMHQENTYGAGH